MKTVLFMILIAVALFTAVIETIGHFQSKRTGIHAKVYYFISLGGWIMAIIIWLVIYFC